MFTLPDEGMDWDDMEEGLLKEALRRAAGNLSKAARLVGLSRPKFKYRAQKHGLL
jgi:DNA-binding protein Fis